MEQSYLAIRSIGAFSSVVNLIVRAFSTSHKSCFSPSRFRAASIPVSIDPDCYIGACHYDQWFASCQWLPESFGLPQDAYGTVVVHWVGFSL